MSVAAILLAAGESRRMGRAKQLLPWGDTTLAGHAASVAATAGLSPVLAVVGARADDVAAAFPEGVEVVVNADWQAGPGTSVAAGVRHVVEYHPAVTAVLLTPIDLPQVTADDLRRLVEAAEESETGVAAAAFDGTLGSPAVFDRRHFAELRSLPAGRGAGPLLRRLSASPVSLPAAAADVDRPEDYRRLRGE